jgi:hypothetical protein
LTVFYAFTAIAVSVLLSNYYDVVTGHALSTLLANAQIGAGDERLFYFATNLFSGFLIGVTVAQSAVGHKVVAFDGRAIAYAIGIWILNAFLLAIFGWVISKDRTDIIGKYKSAAVPIMSDATYTDDELA